MMRLKYPLGSFTPIRFLLCNGKYQACRYYADVDESSRLTFDPKVVRP